MKTRAGSVSAVLLAAALVAALIVAVAPRGYGQSSPPGRYEIDTETVRDLKTGLVWQRALPPDSFSWVAAGQYCAALTLASSSDWRVPSMQELQTLVDESRINPSIDVLAFPDTPAAGFWSGTLWVDTPSLAWHVDFDTGGALYDLATAPNRVRCVR